METTLLTIDRTFTPHYYLFLWGRKKFGLHEVFGHMVSFHPICDTNYK
jgi:hypothetical protein